jgi:tripeptide aminopeptidase
VTVAADQDERRYLNELFVDLCRIESPSGRERGCADRVAAELRAWGVAVEEDDAAGPADTDCGNLLARVPATAAPHPGGPTQVGTGGPGGGSNGPIMLCSHLDTVPVEGPIDPVIVDGGWENAGPGILGADNKAAIAVILTLARRATRAGLPVELELLFTVSEERSLAGARAFDVSRLRSDFGYVFDHASPIGEVIVASPHHYRLETVFHGAAAHAGIRPETGRSAIVAAARAVASMRLGRLDDETTANVGTISGGTAINVVPDRCTLVAEVRCLDGARAEAVVAELVDRVHDAANLPECECDVDVTVERMFAGYRVPASAPAVLAAQRALRDCGYEPRNVPSGGASDANVFQARGLEVVNLANGTERNHEPGERVSMTALEGMLDVALRLVHPASAPASSLGRADERSTAPAEAAPAAVAPNRAQAARASGSAR